MANVLIVYGSTTGNTQAVAEALGSQISGAGHSVDVRSAADVDAAGLCDGKDLVLFGCSAWGDDEVVLQDDFQPLYDAFDTINVSGRKAAAFATGDSSYEHFCGAVDVIEEKLKELGAQLVVPGLKIDGTIDDHGDEVDAWAASVIAAL